MALVKKILFAIWIFVYRHAGGRLYYYQCMPRPTVRSFTRIHDSRLITKGIETIVR